jgi:hypothetical protein
MCVRHFSKGMADHVTMLVDVNATGPTGGTLVQRRKGNLCFEQTGTSTGKGVSIVWSVTCQMCGLEQLKAAFSAVPTDIAALCFGHELCCA